MLLFTAEWEALISLAVPARDVCGMVGSTASKALLC